MVQCGACDPLCAGGCSGPTPSDCVSCASRTIAQSTTASGGTEDRAEDGAPMCVKECDAASEYTAALSYDLSSTGFWDHTECFACNALCSAGCKGPGSGTGVCRDACRHVRYDKACLATCPKHTFPTGLTDGRCVGCSEHCRPGGGCTGPTGEFCSNGCAKTAVLVLKDGQGQGSIGAPGQSVGAPDAPKPTDYICAGACPSGLFRDGQGVCRRSVFFSIFSVFFRIAPCRPHATLL